MIRKHLRHRVPERPRVERAGASHDVRRAFERAWWMSPLLLLPSGCPSRAVIGSDGGATEGDATTMTATGEPADSGAENTLPVAGNDAYLAMMDSAPLAIAANAGVLVNDVDADGDALEVVPQLGVVTAGGAALALQADGSFTYAPAASWWGQDTFEYTVVDDRGGQAIGTVRVVVSPTTIPLGVVAAGRGGFAIDGEASDDASGGSVSAAGDVNGDGLADLIVAAARADATGDNSGRSYVVFGKADTTAVQLSAVAGGTGGFSIDGASEYDYAGGSVSGAGDVNGDGLADLIVGADRTGPNGSGRSYVVFGKADTAGVQLSAVASGVGGFPLDGAASYEGSGGSVSGAGDVNGDGLDDLVVGAGRADPSGYNSGRSYVVFGKADTAAVELSAVASGVGGFVLAGAADSDYAGASVSGAGDVNGDGLADLIVGAYGADANGEDSGRSYVVFGKADTAALALSAVAAGQGGFALDGETAFDESGFSVSEAGDVNGDSLADLIVGAVGADANGSGSGRSYVVFGKSDTASVQLSAVASGAGGFVLDGAAAFDLAGVSVSGAGDGDGDGLADLIVGAAVADDDYAGRGYVVFGKADTAGVQLSAVSTGVGGFALEGEAAYDYAGFSLSTAGDVNGDGFSDVIVGAFGADPNGEDSGRSYVVFGGGFRGL